MATKKTTGPGTRATKKVPAKPGAVIEASTSPRAAAAGTFPVVGIGASAGGLEALDELFRAMPLDTGMAFVVVTHQHPGHTSLLPELLGKITPLKVVQASDGLKVQPDHVYVSAPGGYLAISGGVLHRMDTEKKEAPHLPIDSRKEAAQAGLGRCLLGEAVRGLDGPAVTKAGRELSRSCTLKLLTDESGRPDSICLLAKHPIPGLPDGS